MVNAGGVLTVTLYVAVNVQPNASVTVNPTTGLGGVPLKEYTNGLFCETGVPFTVQAYSTMPVVIELLNVAG